MKNKKGFTLIELLAVIVILAIIMVIAVPQILNVIDSSRESAWTNNARLVKKAIETNSKIIDFETNEARTSPKLLCNNETTSETDVTSRFNSYVKVGDMDIKCKKDGNYIFRLAGKNQFSEREATISCTQDAKCDVTSVTKNGNSTSGSGGNTPTPPSPSPSNDYTYIAPGVDSANTLDNIWGAYIRTDATGYKEVCKLFDNGTACLGYNDFPNNIVSKTAEFTAVMNEGGECTSGEGGFSCSAESTCMNTGRTPTQPCEEGSSLEYDGDAYCEIFKDEGGASVTCSNFGDYECHLQYDGTGVLVDFGCSGND